MWAWMWCGCGAEEGVRPWQIILGSIFQGFWPLPGGLEAFEFGMLDFGGLVKAVAAVARRRSCSAL